MKRRARRSLPWIVASSVLAACAGIYLTILVKQDNLNRQLAAAIEREDEGSAVAFVNAGANPNCSMKGLEQATLPQRIRKLFSHHNKDPEVEATPLLRACAGSKPGPVSSSLLWSGYWPLTTPNINWHPSNLVKAMVDHGALRENMHVGQRAAEIAVSRGDADIVSILHRGGVDLNHLDSDGHSALMLATMHNDVAMIKLLVSLGADVNQRDSAGCTALTVGSPTPRHIEAAEALLKAGADPNIATGTGETALSLSRAEFNTRVEKLLIRHGALGAHTPLAQGPPKIASVFGITFGVDDEATVDSCLTSLLSPGAQATVTTSILSSPQTGPANVRMKAWRLVTPGGSVNLSKLTFEGGVTQNILWLAEPVGSKSTPPSPDVAKLCWLKGIRPGMSRQEVLAITSRTLPRPEKLGDLYSWTQSSVLNSSGEGASTPTYWFAGLYFEKDVLVQLSIQTSASSRAKK